MKYPLFFCFMVISIDFDYFGLFPDYCSFEEQFPVNCGYTLSPGRLKWLVGSGKTPSISTGPSNDHTLRDARGID